MINPIETQAALSAACIRGAGYVMSSQIRVWQVMTQAMLAAPLLGMHGLRRSAAMPQPAPAKLAPAKPAQVKPAQAKPVRRKTKTTDAAPSAPRVRRKKASEPAKVPAPVARPATAPVPAPPATGAVKPAQAKGAARRRPSPPPAMPTSTVKS